MIRKTKRLFNIKGRVNEINELILLFVLYTSSSIDLFNLRSKNFPCRKKKVLCETLIHHSIARPMLLPNLLPLFIQISFRWVFGNIRPLMYQFSVFFCSYRFRFVKIAVDGDTMDSSSVLCNYNLWPVSKMQPTLFIIFPLSLIKINRIPPSWATINTIINCISSSKIDSIRIVTRLVNLLDNYEPRILKSSSFKKSIRIDHTNIMI